MNFLTPIIQAIEWVLPHVFGRELKDDTIKAQLGGYSRESLQLKRNPEDTITIFNYKISKPIAVVFALLVVGAYTFKFFIGIKNQFIFGLTSPKLAPFSGFLLLWCLDSVIPWVIFWILNRTIALRFYAGTIRIPVSTWFSKV